MRRAADEILDPLFAAQLDAIDATLAGEPVDPAHAEIAELALLLAAGRPQIPDEFARSLDERVGRGFAERSPTPAGVRRPRSLRTWLMPLGGLAAALVAGVFAVVVVGSGGSNTNGPFTPASAGTSTSASSSSGAGRSSSAAASSSAAGSALGPAHLDLGRSTQRALKVTPAARPAPPRTSTPNLGAPSGSLPSYAANTGSPNAAFSPQPVPNGRKVIRSAQLALSAQPDHVEAVAQELFNVVGDEKGYVQNSTVTTGNGATSQFTLGVPSQSLGATMTALSQLRDATVLSRTDNVQDVNGPYLSDVRRLADARALRTSLLKQLAQAVTQAEIDSLNARIHDAEASIRSDESTLARLNHQIDYSQITVTLDAVAAVATPHRHSGGGFTLGKAAHDARRVLTVAAGVALIALAALVPVALIAALAWWVGSALRRRRREQALDIA